MENPEKLPGRSRLLPLRFPATICLIFWMLAVVLWRKTGNAFFIFDMGYIGASLGVGTGLYAMLPRSRKPVGRRVAQFLVGLYMIAFLGFIALQNMQLEGLLFYLFTGIFSGAVIHYSIAKIFGPLLFGRGFCGWACWTAMILDLLPYDRSKGWIPGPWRWLRYAHFLLSVGLVGGLVILFGYRPRHWTPLWWLLAGNLLYYAAAIPMAIILKDNRAFCKYLCPVAVVMKVSSRFAMLKIEGISERCDECMACVKMCPMDIRIPDYVKTGQRVLSTECVLCQTCTTVCPTSALSVTWRFDLGGLERLEQRLS